MNRRYVLVVVEGHQAAVRRYTVTRKAILSVLSAAAAFLLLFIGISGWGLAYRPVAIESDSIRKENDALRNLVTRLETAVADERRHLKVTQLSFTQLWEKSGLGFPTPSNGIGPVEESERFAPEKLASALSGRIDSSDPIGLPMELERITDRRKQVLRELTGLYEYFNDAERMLSNTPSIRPVVGAWVTSSFGRRRDPIDGRILMHKGMDFGGRTGMEIQAPADAQVIYVGRRGGYGETVVLDHGYGLQTHFAHLSRYRVKRGQRVKRGEIIAEMGSTGKSTGPHLHYEVRRMGQPLNPAPFVLD